MQEEKQIESKFAFMLDVSGSVSGSQNYWSTIERLVQIHGQQVEHYYFWDSRIEKVTKKDYENAIKNRMGRGGTSPELVAIEVIQKELKNIILVTDGCVSDSSVRQCDKTLENYKFNQTICYIISTSSYSNNSLNMSVTCPFTRNCQNEVYQKPTNGEIKKITQFTPEDYKILDTLDDITLENFNENYDKIEGLIIALNMGKEGNIPLKNQLVVMKNRLLQELSKRNGKKDISIIIRQLLEKGDLQSAQKQASLLTKKYHQDNMVKELGGKITHLITLCGDLRGKYDLNAIKSNKMAHAKDAEEGKIADVDIAQLSNNPIECPIIMEEDVPQILIDDCQPIFSGVEQSIVKDITTCPLRLLHYPDLMKKLKERLSNFIGVKFSSKFFKNPFTQNKLLGAIPLGCHHSHIKVGNHTIAKLFSDGKILGNLNLFYAVIWHIIKEKQIEYLKQIENNATEHLLFRMKNTKTMASLSGIPQLCNVQVNTDIAVWYCVNSCTLNLPPNSDTFRFHTYSMDGLISILDTLHYPYRQQAKCHLARIKALLTSQFLLKKMSLEGSSAFKQSFLCLNQNYEVLNYNQIKNQVIQKEKYAKFIPTDGKVSEQKVKDIISLYPHQLKNLPVQQIKAIGDLLDVQKNASSIPIDYNFKQKIIEEEQNNWQDYQCLLKGGKVRLCSKKFMPIPVDNNQKWADLKKIKFFNTFKYFQAFINKFKMMPTKDQLILYCYNHLVRNGKKKTLPKNIVERTEILLEAYRKLMEEQGISEKDLVKSLIKGIKL